MRKLKSRKGKLKRNLILKKGMLNAMDLLVALNDKIIEEDVFVTLPHKPIKRQFRAKGKISKVAKADTLHVLNKRKKKEKLRKILRKAQKPSLKLNVSLNRPLSPAYHPSRVVSEVWQKNPQLEDLYRYTNFGRLVYPPGFVAEESNINHN